MAGKVYEKKVHTLHVIRPIQADCELAEISPRTEVLDLLGRSVLGLKLILRFGNGCLLMNRCRGEGTANSPSATQCHQE